MPSSRPAGRDFYAILGVPRTADSKAIKRAYKKRALKCHPDKVPAARREAAEAEFKDLAEAVSVLTDPEKKALYDQYGEAGLQHGGVPEQYPEQPQGGFGGGQQQFFRPGGNGGFTFSSSGGGGGMNGFTSAGINPEDIFRQFFQQTGTTTTKHGVGGFEPNFAPPQPKKKKRFERNFQCTLEELYRGVTKKMKVSRNDGRGAKILEIPVRAGMRAGSKFVFENEGDNASDLVFVLQQRPHAAFKRDGPHDLTLTVRVGLEDALTGVMKTVRHLSGEALRIAIPDRVVSPDYMHVMKGKGMPVVQRDGTTVAYGDLKVRFDIKFPRTLDSESKDLVRRALKA